MNPADLNLPLLESVTRALGALRERFVFVGGCMTGVLVTDVAAAPVRATQDIDVIVEVLTLADYHALAPRPGLDPGLPPNFELQRRRLGTGTHNRRDCSFVPRPGNSQ